MKQYFEKDDEDAVSPVIGVILMVAITVILAAVIGAFVLQIGSEQETVPQARFDFQQDGEAGTSGAQVEISHKGGDTIDNTDGDTLEILVAGKGESAGVGQFSDTEITAGTSTTVDVSGATVSVSKGDLVEIKWTSDSGKRTNILQDYELQ